MFEGPTISLRTIKDVGEGEEFVLSYINLLATTQIRQMELKDGYMFTCKCAKCTGKGVGDFMMMSIKCDKCSCFQSLHEESGKAFSYLMCEENSVRLETSKIYKDAHLVEAKGFPLFY